MTDTAIQQTSRSELSQGLAASIADGSDTLLSPLGTPTTPPTYSGPTEVLIDTPVTLNGNYDANRIAKIAIAAEDKFALGVTTSNGTWHVSLPKGFSQAGSRWLRLKGFDKVGKLVENKVFYLTVSADPLTVGQALTLKVTQDTYFKTSPVDSSTLKDQQKVFVKAGQTLPVNRYGFVDGHLKVELGQDIPAIGNFGFFYEPCVQLSKGDQILRFSLDDVPDIALAAQLLITSTTVIKAQLGDSSTLSSQQKSSLLQGQTLQIVGYACTGGHFRVTLAEPIAGFGNRGYIYWQYAQIKRNGKEIPYDSGALSVTALTNTILKKRPVDSAQLQPEEQTNFAQHTFYGVSSYMVQGGHFKVSLTEEIPGFGNTGYVFPKFAQMKRGTKAFNPILPSVEMNVPYFSQRDNPRYYWSTCNVTSIAMIFYYYGVRSQYGQLEDELLQWCINKEGLGSQTNHNTLTALIQAYGFKSSFDTRRTWRDVKEELMNGKPVVLCGLFTHGGHIITVVGFTPDGFIVNDPWGDALTGYTYTEGRKLLYPYSYCQRVCGKDGDVWAHFISR
ncbi:C39 family peptidase [Myxacorys almedinensis]|uniref:Peptidase C39-like domain-containing protein n=1 Tax=Myxacorys almedinensis A TaxID=2690445 RepID=A0A8J8CHT7_9CYAN|nr:C39 family peptidase [Myxacorys almedinensis]NDJ17029.1 hypothetical protein [Myxacorys almedinensis A]